MTFPATRLTAVFDCGPEISHSHGTEVVTNPNGYTYVPRQPGDVGLSAFGTDAGFEVSMSHFYTNESGHLDSRDAEITLNEAEAHEVLLALTVWLEGRT